MRLYQKPSIGSRIFDIGNIAFMLILGFTMVYPFVNLLAISFNDGIDAVKGGIYFWPRHFSTSAYALLFENDNMLKGLKWSVLRVLAGTATCLFATGLLAYIVTIRHFSGRKFIRVVFFYTMYLSGGLIPVYLLIMNLGLANTFWVYLLPGLFNVYYMLLMASYIQNLPEALFESARIDGASELGIYWRIVVPVSVPVFAAISIYLAVNHWNSWFDVILYNAGGDYDTVQVYLRRLLLEAEGMQQIHDQQLAYQKYKDMSPITLRAATTIIVVLPILMIYPFFQKYFIGGITLGSVKG